MAHSPVCGEAIPASAGLPVQSSLPSARNGASPEQGDNAIVSHEKCGTVLLLQVQMRGFEAKVKSSGRGAVISMQFFGYVGQIFHQPGFRAGDDHDCLV